MKETPEGLQPKARIVAHGFEKNCLNKRDNKSPTCSKDFLCIILIATAQIDWHLKYIDSKTVLFSYSFVN